MGGVMNPCEVCHEDGRLRAALRARGWTTTSAFAEGLVDRNPWSGRIELTAKGRERAQAYLRGPRVYEDIFGNRVDVDA